MSVDPRSDRPIYHQIGDDLRKKITSGAIPRGSKLPSEAELTREYDVTRLTVRRALAVLAAEGLTEPVRGKGVFVRKTSPVIRLGRSRFSRAAREAGKGAFAAEAERLGLPWDQEELEVAVVPTPHEAQDLWEDTRCWVKRRRMILNGEPTQLADSYVPYGLAHQLGLDDGGTAPGGLYGFFDKFGHTVTRFREELSVRSAAPEESVALHLPIGSPVAVLRRIAFDQYGLPLEWFDSVATADHHRWVYEFDAAD